MGASNDVWRTYRIRGARGDRGRRFGGEAAIVVSPRSWVVCAACVLTSLLLNVAYLSSGFQADDILFLNMREMDPLPFSRWAGLWSTPVDEFEGFRSLWWLDSEVRGSFFRPLPSLVIEGSVELFGERALPLHLLSVLLHGCVGFTVYRLFSKLSGSWVVPLLAAFVFLTCEDHSMGVGWIATITDILCVLFVNLGLLEHLKYRTTRHRGRLVSSLGFLVLALISKESAVLAPAAIVLIELFLGENDHARVGEPEPFALKERLRQWVTRARFWVPAATLSAAYLVAYKLGGFGVSSLLYLNPMSRPLAYLHNVALGLPTMVLAAVSPAMPSLAMFFPEAGVPLALAGLVVAVLFGWGLWALRREPLVRLGLSMFVVALLPQLATLPSERLLYFPMVFGSYVIARLLVEIGPIARRLWPHRAPAPLMTRVWAYNLWLGAVLPGVLLSALLPWSYRESLSAPEREALTALPIARETNPLGIVVLNTGGMFTTFYVGGILQYHLRRPVPVHTLSAAHARFTLVRLSSQSFELRADRAGWLSNPFAGLVRANPVFEVGRRYDVGLFTAELVELTPEGRDVLRVRFEFREPIAREEVLLLTWNGEQFERLDFSSLADGESRFLADTSDVFAAMMGHSD